MTARASLAALFSEHLAEGEASVDEDTLAGILADARAAWPGVVVDDAPFIRHLALRVRDGRTLSALKTGDLYLACACADGQRAALDAFEHAYLAQLPSFLGRIDRSTPFVEEVRQLVRERLFVGPSAKIADYSGHGALAAWVRVIAVRTALALRRGDGRSEPEDEARALAATPDPELDYIKMRYRAPFEAALRDALAALDKKDRTFLRLHFVDGLGIDRIGALYQVHRATAARWIATAREALFDRARALLTERLHLRPDEFESLANVMRSQLEVSLHGLLRDGD